MTISLLELEILKEPDKDGRAYWICNQEDFEEAMVQKGMTGKVGLSVVS